MVIRAMHGELRIVHNIFAKRKYADRLFRFKGRNARLIDDVHMRRIRKHRHVYHLEIRSYWLRLILDVVY